MDHLQQLQPKVQKSNTSRQNPLCLSQSTSVFSNNKGATAGPGTATTNSGLSLTKEKSAQSKKAEYKQQKVIINKI
jgi:hypothetical protein